MGIGGQIVEALIRETKYKPLRGDALLIGRQTVYFKKLELLARMHELGVTPPSTEISANETTIDRLPGYDDQELISDTSLMKLVGADRVLALDHSAYEGAEIVHDLRFPIPDRLAESADVLVDGSTLDNVFTPATVLQNFTRLLRPGGRMFLSNAFSSFESAYIIMPPMWYIDYFVMNGFADCRAYVFLFQNGYQNTFGVDLAKLHDLKRGMGHFPVAQSAATLIFAEKGINSTYDKLPIQQHYRPTPEWDTYQRNLGAMLESKRPEIARSSADPFIPDVQGGYRYVNKDFVFDDDALDRARQNADASSAPPETILARLRRRTASIIAGRAA